MLDEQLQRIEQELMRLPLRRAPATLDSKVAQARLRASIARRRNRMLSGLGVVAAVAACLLVAAAVVDWGGSGGQHAESASPIGVAYSAPIQIEQLWSSVAAEPDVLDGDGQAVRIQHQVVHQIRWIDEDRNIRIQWDFPSVHTETMPLEHNQWPVEYN